MWQSRYPDLLVQVEVLGLNVLCEPLIIRNEVTQGYVSKLLAHDTGKTIQLIEVSTVSLSDPSFFILENARIKHSWWDGEDFFKKVVAVGIFRDSVFCLGELTQGGKSV